MNPFEDRRVSPRLPVTGHKMFVTVNGHTTEVKPLNCSGRGIAFISKTKLLIGTKGSYNLLEISSGYHSVELEFVVVSSVTTKIGQHLIGASLL